MYTSYGARILYWANGRSDSRHRVAMFYNRRNRAVFTGNWAGFYRGSNIRVGEVSLKKNHYCTCRH